MTASAWEDYMEQQLVDAKFPKWEKEYRFKKPRRWRMDFAWPEHKVALEVEGGVFSGGRHTTGAGFTKDCEKYAHATLEGYRIIRVTTGQISTGQALEWIKEYFERHVDGISR